MYINTHIYIYIYIIWWFLSKCVAFESTLLIFLYAQTITPLDLPTLRNGSIEERRVKGGVNLRTGKLKRIKTQVMSRHPWHSG